MRDQFYSTCGKCKTQVIIKEVGNKYPAKTYDHYYCPVCGCAMGQKNTMYSFEESVESLENTIEPYKSEYIKK